MPRKEEALSSYKNCLEIDSNNKETHNCIGNLFCDLKRFDEAVYSYNKAIQID